MKTKSLMAFLSLFIFATHAWADVPEVDAVTRKLQMEFIAGKKPTFGDLRAKYKWSCDYYSAVPNESDFTSNNSVDVYNEFNGLIKSSVDYRTSGLHFDFAWAESKDLKSLERVDTMNVYNPNSHDAIITHRYMNLRVYKGTLVIEWSAEVKPEIEAIYNVPLALWSHAVSDPNRALLAFFVCPL